MTTLKESTEDAPGLYARIQKAPQYNYSLRLEDIHTLTNSMSVQYKRQQNKQHANRTTHQRSL
nr:MAG TPA: hypothetical protein [Caudoviricetes sp.]